MKLSTKQLKELNHLTCKSPSFEPIALFMVCLYSLGEIHTPKKSLPQTAHQNPCKKHFPESQK